jgi:TfoX/Sxy family transcriptional regulator of competence genes
MAHGPKALQAICVAAAPPDLELAFKPMFGGIMAYADGKVLASLSDVGLALKLAGADREALLAIPGSKPLRYAPDQPPSKTYVVVPDAMLGDAAGLRAWISRCFAGLTPKSANSRKRPAGK